MPVAGCSSLNAVIGKQRSRTLRPRALLAVIFIASVIIGLNGTMLNVVLPDAVADLGASAFEGTWMLLAYLLANGALLVLMGQISDLYNPRTVFLSGLAAFAGASALLVFAPDPLVFILGRAVQGAGAAMLLSNSATILALVFRGRKLGSAMGLYLAGFAVAQVAGPSVGGLAAMVASWQWVFVVTLVISLVTLAMAWGTLAALPPRQTDANARVDWRGNAVIIVAVAALLYGLSRAQDIGWGTAQVIVPAAVAVLLCVVLVLIERRITHPAVNLAVLGNRTFLFANWAGATMLVPRVVITLLLSLYFQGAAGDSPAVAALKITPLPAGVAIGSVLGPRLANIAGERRTALWLAVIALAAVIPLMFTVPSSRHLIGTYVAIAVVGLSTGAFATLNTTTILRSASLKYAGSVNSVRNVFQALGQMVGTSLMLTIVSGGVAAAQATHFLAGDHRQLTAESLRTIDHRYVLAFVVIAGLCASAIAAYLVVVRAGRHEPDES